LFLLYHILKGVSNIFKNSFLIQEIVGDGAKKPGRASPSPTIVYIKLKKLDFQEQI